MNSWIFFSAFHDIKSTQLHLFIALSLGKILIIHNTMQIGNTNSKFINLNGMKENIAFWETNRPYFLKSSSVKWTNCRIENNKQLEYILHRLECFLVSLVKS